jgi:hypothetical protein
MFGGFEWRLLNGHRENIPTRLTEPDGTGIAEGICPDCTAAGCGDAAWAAFYKAQHPDPPLLPWPQTIAKVLVNFFTERVAV